MANLVFRGRSLALHPGETVLECLERHGTNPPSSCRAGHCRTCMMRAVDGPVPENATAGLEDGERTQGLFLPCVCRPEGDLVVATPEGQEGLPTTVLTREPLADGIVSLELLPSLPFPFRPGQFVHLIGPGGVVRPYSLANAPDAPLEIHVKKLPGGALSPWLVDEVSAGDSMEIRGPFGRCTYEPGTPDQPLLLVGVSTGLAPLLGIVRDAIAHGHTGAVDLFFGARNPAGLYRRDVLEQLARDHANVTVHLGILEGRDAEATTAPIEDQVLAEFPDPAGRKIYLCGSPEIVESLETELRARSSQPLAIESDPFFHAR